MFRVTISASTTPSHARYPGRPARADRLRRDGAVLRRGPRGRVGTSAPDPDQHGLLPLRTLPAGLDHRPRLPLGQSRRAGSDRHGRVGRQVRHHDEPLLLGRRDPGDAVRGPLHDAVLLRLARPLRARVPQAALRREDADAQRGHLRGDDDLLLRHLHVRDGQAASSCCSAGTSTSASSSRPWSCCLHAPRRTHQRHLQRGAAVLPDRLRVRCRSSVSGCTRSAGGMA